MIGINNSFIKLMSLIPITLQKEELGGDSTTEDDLISSQITPFLGESLEIGDCSANHTSALT